MPVFRQAADLPGFPDYPLHGLQRWSQDLRQGDRGAVHLLVMVIAVLFTRSRGGALSSSPVISEHTRAQESDERPPPAPQLAGRTSMLPPNTLHVWGSRAVAGLQGGGPLHGQARPLGVGCHWLPLWRASRRPLIMRPYIIQLSAHEAAHPSRSPPHPAQVATAAATACPSACSPAATACPSGCPPAAAPVGLAQSRVQRNS